MIIRKIQIENYLCYYDINTFELSEGLNIILGENGEGKTKFFEAIDWLFNGDNKNLEVLVSAKKLDETEAGESFRVGVSLVVEQYGEKSTISKSFLATKEKVNECSASTYMIEGITENASGERIQVDGKSLLDRIFPFQIRKYSMFKGEAELNIFDNDNALSSLINLFSEAKHYEKYAEKGCFLREKAEKAVEDCAKLDKKNALLYKNLEGEINALERIKGNFERFLKTTEEEIEKISENLQEAERHVSNADALDVLNKRINELEGKISKKSIQIDENYTTALFDKNWILVNFEPIQKEFAEKVALHSNRRRALQSEFDRQKGIREGEKKAKASLMNGFVPLPIGVPSKSHMEEMLKDEICKVCNRDAKKGSDAYEFMMTRLAEYLSSQRAEEQEDDKGEVLFKYDFTNRLEHLSVSHEDNLKNLRSIRSNIKEFFEFNKTRKDEIDELNKALDKEKLERERILGKSTLIEEKLINVLKNYNAWQGDLKDKNKDVLNYDSKLKATLDELKQKNREKDKIDTNSANSFMIKTRDILRDIETIFKETKEKKFDEFIVRLQNKSNSFFRRINIDAFTGEIVFVRKKILENKRIKVELQEDGRPFYKPNQSLLTSMHISILFAISELAAEIKEENFPVIFDAPTSSFGENKTAQFLNLVYETEGQKVLLIKDFLQTDKISKSLGIKREFESVKRHKAFWVRLDRPFDPNNLKTINTEVIAL